MKETLRIALFTYSTKPRGGVIHTLSLAEHLVALGHQVHIFALGKGQDGFFRPTSVPYTLIPIEGLAEDAELEERIQRYIQAYYQFLMANASDPFDIYHVQDCISANAVWRVRETGRIRSFVRTIHHVDDFVSPSLIQCQKDSIYRPDHRLVVSRYWQERLQVEYGVESEVIYNGVDLQRFRPPHLTERAVARRQFGLNDEFTFLNIGGIEPRKNTIRLLQAFERVKHALERQGRKSVVLLAGGETLLDYTPYRQEFFSWLEKSTLELGKDVRVLGVVGDEQLPQLYQAADVLAFPSVKEGWGLVALEALASGLAVLASDLPVFREYLDPCDNALLIDPFDQTAIADGMLRLAEDPEIKQRLASSGPQTARQFSWEASARAHVACYQRWSLEGQG